MAYSIKEVSSIPDEPGKFTDEIPALIDAAMESKTGIVAIKFDTMEECHSRTSSIVSWVKRHQLDDVFTVRQRRGTCFIKELRSAERHGLE